MPERDRAHLDAVAAHLGATAYGVEPLSGGLTNRNYLLELPGGARYVVRVVGRDTELLGIDRARERVVARQMAAVGIGAELVEAGDTGEVQVTRFLEATTLTPALAADPAMLRRLAGVLRAVHDGPAFPGQFRPLAAARELAQEAARRGVAPPPDLLAQLETGARIEAALGEPAWLSPCHNDMLAANFLVEGPPASPRLRLIDWEYAAMDDPAFDLGNLATNLGLTPDQEAMLLAAYAGEASEAGLARLRLMRLASDMREGAWGLLQAALVDPTTSQTDYRAYARTHLDRFAAGAQGAAFERWLALAPQGE